MFSRGQVVPVINLRVRFGFDRTAREPADASAGRAARRPQCRDCWPTKRASSSRIADGSIQPPSDAIGDLSGNYLDGVATLGDRIVLILNVVKWWQARPPRRRQMEASGYSKRRSVMAGKGSNGAGAAGSTASARRGELDHRRGRPHRENHRRGVRRRRRAGPLARQRAERPEPDDRLAQGDGDAGRVHRDVHRRPRVVDQRGGRLHRAGQRECVRARLHSSSRRRPRFSRAALSIQDVATTAQEMADAAEAGDDVDGRDDRVGQSHHRRHRCAGLVGQPDRGRDRGDDAIDSGRGRQRRRARRVGGGHVLRRQRNGGLDRRSDRDGRKPRLDRRAERRVHRADGSVRPIGRTERHSASARSRRPRRPARPSSSARASRVARSRKTPTR